jgi:hypothetical protein
LRLACPPCHATGRISHDLRALTQALIVGSVLGDAGIAVIGVIAVISTFAQFAILPFVVSLFMMMTGVMLTVTALMSNAFLYTYFAFLRFPMGSGFLMLVSGAMTFGSYGTLGQVFGGICIGWGFLSIICHIMWRSSGHAYNITLLGR